MPVGSKVQIAAINREGNQILMHMLAAAINREGNQILMLMQVNNDPNQRKYYFIAKYKQQIKLHNRSI